MKDLEEIAKRHGVSVETAQTLYEGLRRSNGTQVQFNLPELGGMGQWMPTMMMIGRMNDHALKAKVDALCCDLARLAAQTPIETSASPAETPHWWPEELGTPNAVGGQNDARYAYFAAKERLAVFHNDKITLYDTKNYRISGFGQQQQNAIPGTLLLHTDRGAIALEILPVIK